MHIFKTIQFNNKTIQLLKIGKRFEQILQQRYTNNKRITNKCIKRCSMSLGKCELKPKRDTTTYP